MTANMMWLLLLLAAGARRAEAVACGPTEFACATTDQCFPDDYVCDDFDDCDDGSDEDPAIDCEAYYADMEEEETSGATDYNQIDEEVVAGQDSTEPAEPPEQCSLKKCEVGNKFKLMDGQTHYYTYETKSETRVAGSSPSNTSLTIHAQLALTILTACELKLQVQDMVVETTRSDSGGQMEVVEDNFFVAAVTKNPLRFAYNDGLVEELCPVSDEDPNALNFKRGVVSLLQNTMPRLDLDYHTTESDVVGHCEVDYQVVGVAGKGLLLKKTRNIPSCTARSSTTSFIKGVEYDFVGGIHTVPLLDTSSECVQEIAEGRVASALCQELHRFTPFSSEQGGIFTTVTQTLNFTHSSAIPSAKMGSVHARTNLLYDYHNHVHTEGAVADGADDADFWRSHSSHILDKIAENTQNEGVATNAPRLFLELVQALRHLSFQELWAINEERGWGLERSVFNDALPMLGTGGSVGVMRDLMGQDHNNILTNTWLTSLSFIPRPDLDTISEAAPLLEVERVHADAFLGVGSLVQTYCRDHPLCHEAPPVLRVMDTLHRFIGDSCQRETSQDKIQVLMALKGIGNAGAAVTEDIPGSLAKCFFNEENENEIRLGGITAFRRFPCEVSRAPLQMIFHDHTQDAELRIAAYLELMRCPDFQVVKVVKEALLNEEVNQVGSFVWTHLENLKETSMPSRAHLQGLISNEAIASKFTADVRKFSRNIELSGFYDQLNVGGNMDASVVFSQESYIPRSATFNFTTDLFGHSLNLLEWLGMLNLRGNSKNFTLSGPLLHIHGIIAETMKTCLELVVPPDMQYGTRLANGSWTGIMTLIDSREVDMTGVPMLVNAERSSVVDLGFPMLGELVALSYIRPVQRSDLAGFVKPFTPQVWATLLAGLAAVLTGMLLVQVIEARRPRPPDSGWEHQTILQEPWWAAGQWTVGALLAQAWRQEPNTTRLRVLAGVWLLISFVLVTVYRSNLKAMLILPRLIFPFNSLEELIQTNIPCYVLEASVSHENIKAAEPGTALHTLEKQLITHTDDKRAAQDFLSGKHVVIAGSFSLWFVTQMRFRKTKTCEYYTAENLLSTSYSILFPKGSKLKPAIDSILSRLGDAGITDHLLKANFQEAKNCLNKDKSVTPTAIRSLGLGDFYGVFSLYVGAVVASGLAFLMELWLH